MPIDFANPKFTEDDLRRMRKEIDVELKVRVDARVSPQLRRKYGSYANRVKIRKCKGCGHDFNARDMRTHPCSISYLRR